MAQGSTTDNALVSLYSDRITEPSTNDEVYGYWLFVLGLIASVVGVALFMYSATLSRPPAAEGGTYWLVRETGIVLAGVGMPLMLGGVAIRLPLRQLATRIVGIGIIVCLLAIVWFITVYPAGGWPVDTGHSGVIGLYTLGLVIIGLASVFVPMLSRSETETASERAERERSEQERSDLEADLERTRQERDDAKAEPTQHVRNWSRLDNRKRDSRSIGTKAAVTAGGSDTGTATSSRPAGRPTRADKSVNRECTASCETQSARTC